MRLAEVRRRGTLMHRFEVVWWCLRASLYATDLHRAMRYGPEFFGRAFASYVQSVLRQPGSGTWMFGDSPSDLGPEDIVRLRAARISDADILEAIHIRTVFGITTRLADALGFEIPPLKVLQQRARTSRNADPTR